MMPFSMIDSRLSSAAVFGGWLLQFDICCCKPSTFHFLDVTEPVKLLTNSSNTFEMDLLPKTAWEKSADTITFLY